MDTLEAITTRHSVAPAFLTEPGPDEAVLLEVLQAGATAPDHGRLRPWQFLIIRGEARVRLGEVFADALRARAPDATDAALEQERQRPLRAPLVVAVIGRIDCGHAKIPAVEQILSVGAAAQNVLLAAHARGFGAKWLTGGNAYDEKVKTALGVGPDDILAGFLHIGTIDGAPPAAAHAAADEYAREWSGPDEQRAL